MKRRGLSTLSVLAMLATFPATAQETVVGFFEGISGGFNSGSGAMTLTGWVVASSGVRQVVVQVDGVDIGQAIYGLPRPDVTAVYPGFPDSGFPGFGYNLNSTDFRNGQHQVSVKVFTNAGRTLELNGTRNLNFNNNTHILVPFGDINHPQRSAQLFGTCPFDPFPPSPRRYSIIEGWALDLGVEIGDTGVSWVELLVDGSIVGDSKTTCRFDPNAGGLTDCYGLPRPDIERLYPFALDAPSSGFRFALDVGALIDFGFARGHHVLTIRAGDITSQQANIAEIPVTFFCAGDLGNEGSFGRIESPRIGRAYEGVILFQGWRSTAKGCGGSISASMVSLSASPILASTADRPSLRAILATRIQQRLSGVSSMTATSCQTGFIRSRSWSSMNTSSRPTSAKSTSLSTTFATDRELLHGAAVAMGHRSAPFL